MFVWVICMHLANGLKYKFKPIRIGTILPANTTRYFSIDRVKPALQIAVDKVKYEYCYLTDRDIEILYADSHCSVADGMNEAIKFYYEQKVDVFFGPCCDYSAAPVGRQLKFWKTPMVTPGAIASDFADKKNMYAHMTRVGASITSLNDFLQSLLWEFKWTKFQILYDPKGHDEISEKICHITVDGIHYGFPDPPPYYKFDELDMILKPFAEVVGRDRAG